MDLDCVGEGVVVGEAVIGAVEMRAACFAPLLPFAILINEGVFNI